MKLEAKTTALAGKTEPGSRTMGTPGGQADARIGRPAGTEADARAEARTDDSADGHADGHPDGPAIELQAHRPRPRVPDDVVALLMEILQRVKDEPFQPRPLSPEAQAAVLAYDDIRRVLDHDAPPQDSIVLFAKRGQ